MLSYFRLNDPYRLIGLLVVLLLLFLPALIGANYLTYPEFKGMLIGERILNGSRLYTGIVDSTAPLTGWLYAVTSFMFGDGLTGRHILGFVILFLEAVVLGIIFIDKKVFPESSFLPSLIFGILCAFSFDTITLNGELFALLFILLALNSLFKEVEFREQLFEMVLKTGFYIGIASLFEFSFSIYVFAALVILVLYTRTTGRKIALLLVGFILPHLLMFCIYNYYGSVNQLWRYYYLPNLGFSKDSYLTVSNALLLLAPPLFLFLASLVALNRESRFTKYQSQVLQAMFFWTIFSVVQVYYSKTLRAQSFLSVMVGLSFFISHFFTIVSRRRFGELLFWVFLASVVTISIVSSRSLRDSVYQSYIILERPQPYAHKKIAVFSDDISLYHDASLATPFLNWRLSKEILLAPEYYENVISVADAFDKDLPEIIIDPAHLLTPFLERIPELQKRYSKSEQGYVLVR